MFGTVSTSAQTFMIYDIAPLQYMYGANFNHVGEVYTYTWSTTTGAQFIDGVSQGTSVDNHIFQTIWTAGAASTYDLSNFSQNQVDVMNPGGSMFSPARNWQISMPMRHRNPKDKSLCVATSTMLCFTMPICDR